MRMRDTWCFYAMAARKLLLGLYALLTLLDHARGQVIEEPLECFQSTTDCSGTNISISYSECCSSGTESFILDEICYMCSNLLRFTTSLYEVIEGARYIGIGVQRTVNPGTSTFFFSTIINDITALAGVDYGQFPDSGVGLINLILEGESLVDSVVVIIDDNIVEYNENFTVSLQPLSRDYRPLGGIQDTAVVTITDDDQVDITLEPPGPLSVVESSIVSFTLNKTGLAARPVEVTVDISDPELQYSDGQPDTRTFTFKPDDFQKMIDVRVLDDTIVEATEEHVIQLRAPVGETGVNLPRDSEIINVLDDGDTVSIGLSVIDSTVEETVGTVSVTLEKIGENERPVFVRVFTENITATGGVDYSAIDRLVEVPSQGIVTISVNVTEDGVVEETEFFNLVLEVPPSENGVILSDNNITAFTLTDTDILMVNISATRLMVAEGESVSLLISGSGAQLNRDIEILISTASSDIDVSPLTVILRENQLQSSVTIFGMDDNLYEGAESAQLTITSLDRAVRFFSPTQSVDVQIMDNDSPQLFFSEDVYTFNETQSMGSITVSFNAATETSHSWTLTSVPITATEGVDYTGINQELTFSNTSRTRTVSFSIIDDLLSEGIESFRLELRNQDGELINSSLVRILDNEKLELSFTNSSFTVGEGEGFFYLTIVKSGVTTSDITVDLNITDGTATGGVDYGVFPTPVFPAVTLILSDETSIQFPILIRNDALVENPETFNVALVLRNTDGTIIQGDIGKTIVTIEDDDKVEVFLSGGGGEVNEGGSEDERELVFTVSRNENVTLTRSVSVVLSTSDDSARASSGDYNSSSVTFTFTPSGLVSFKHDINVLDDDTVENRERFFVELSPFEGETALILPQNATPVYIIDNDRIRVDFVDLSYTVSESDGSAVILLSKSGMNEIPVMVSVVTETQDATAIAGADYNATIEPVEFLSNQNQVPINIPILDDATVEEVESFTVVLSVAGTDENVVIGSQNTTRVTIIDNDVVAVRFRQAEYSGEEGGTVSIAVELSTTADRIIEVEISAVVNDSADASDFSLSSNILTFSPGTVRQTVDVMLTDDIMCDAAEESFSLDLIPRDPGIAVLGTPSSTQITITDDDRCIIQFMNGTNVSVDEPITDSQISLCVGLGDNLILDRDVTFVIVAEERTDLPVDQQALPGVDYEFNPLIMTLEPPAKIICFNVTILPDDRMEMTKFFNLSIIPADPQLQSDLTDISVGIEPNETTTAPPTSDLPTVEFSSSTYSVNESDGVVEIILDISPPPTNDPFLRSVLFNTVDGNATAPDDYVAQIDSIITIAGSMARVIVDIVTDDEAEGLESFSINIRIPDGVIVERLLLGSITSATITIIDPEPVAVPTVQFSSNVYSVAERDGIAEITLSISPSPSDSFPRSIVFNTIDGTATAPEDYVAQIDSIVTLTGSTASISVDIVSDGVAEETERFTISIRIPDGIPTDRLMLGSLSTATVIITDRAVGPVGDFVNDTVTGDPFFIVPLSLAENSSSFRNEPALCYEIHGESGQIFNLLSDTCTSVNAYYFVSAADSQLNFISDIGIKTVDLNQNCIDLRISVNQSCTPEVRDESGQFVTQERYESGGVSVRKMGDTVRISVPNCAPADLVMWVTCRVVSSQPQLRFDIRRGSDLNPTSHGLLGQFWNIPVRVTSYTFTGTIVYDAQSEELYLMEIFSPDGFRVLRRFIAEFNPITWDHNRVESCLFAGDQQGGRVLEFTTYNDPVIENNYRLYRMDNLFSTDYRFSKFEEERCTNG